MVNFVATKAKAGQTTMGKDTNKKFRWNLEKTSRIANDLSQDGRLIITLDLKSEMIFNIPPAHS